MSCRLSPISRRYSKPLGVSDDSRIILYGDASVLPATRAYFTLDYLGHGDQAALLDGGLEKWRSEGRTLSKEATVAAAGHFTPHPKPELVVQIDEVKQLSSEAGDRRNLRSCWTPGPPPTLRARRASTFREP